jgi:hypothetical protein
MSESDIAKKAKKLIKTVDDLVITVKTETVKVLEAAKDISDKLKDKK